MTTLLGYHDEKFVFLAADTRTVQASTRKLRPPMSKIAQHGRWLISSCGDTRAQLVIEGARPAELAGFETIGGLRSGILVLLERGGLKLDNSGFYDAGIIVASPNGLWWLPGAGPARPVPQGQIIEDGSGGEFAAGALTVLFKDYVDSGHSPQFKTNRFSRAIRIASEYDSGTGPYSEVWSINKQTGEAVRTAFGTLSR